MSEKGIETDKLAAKISEIREEIDGSGEMMD